MSNIEPNLLNKTTVKIQQEVPAQTRYDHRRRTPINIVARSAVKSFDAQVKWSMSDTGSRPEMSQAGETERNMSYFVCRTKDLAAKGITIKKDDKIVEMAEQTVELFVHRIEYASHYQGKPRLLKVILKDRKGETNG